MKCVQNYFVKWFVAPTYLELSCLYFLLGIYIPIVTDAVIPVCWITFTVISFFCITIILFCRAINFFIILKTKQLKDVWIRWAQLGFIAIIFVLLFCGNIGLKIRLKLSERSFRKEVDKIFMMPSEVQDQLSKAPPLQVGIFCARIYKVDMVNQSIWFYTEDGEALFWMHSLFGGIVYSNQGPPAEIGETQYQHLWGPWWRWAQDI